MATLLPPPSKRQRVAQAEKAREQHEIQGIPTDLGSVRVQFFDQATGNPTGPAVSVPVADANVKNLETLLNTLQGNVGMLVNRDIAIVHRADLQSPSRMTMSAYRIASLTNPKRMDRLSTSPPICIIHSFNPGSELRKIQYLCTLRRRRFFE